MPRLTGPEMTAAKRAKKVREHNAKIETPCVRHRWTATNKRDVREQGRVRYFLRDARCRVCDTIEDAQKWSETIYVKKGRALKAVAA